MRKSSVYAFYAFGYNYGLLVNNTNTKTQRTIIIKRIQDLFGKFGELNLPVTTLVAKPLEKFMGELKALEGETITATHTRKLSDILDKVDAALDAELQLKKVYVLTEKRYDLEKLWDKPDALLAADVYATLPGPTAKDFWLACKQIALNQPTSASFHMMRAVEAEVKRLYCAFKKTKRLERPMWGPMLDQLRKKNKPRPTAKLLDHLDGIRIHFRNPTQHPEVFYTLDEAQDLLNQTIVAINMVSAELTGRRKP